MFQMVAEAWCRPLLGDTSSLPQLPAAQLLLVRRCDYYSLRSSLTRFLLSHVSKNASNLLVLSLFSGSSLVLLWFLSDSSLVPLWFLSGDEVPGV